jgi:hypothetical protein
MTALPADLLERARRHGLTPTEQFGWVNEDRRTLVAWLGGGLWGWGRPGTPGAYLLPWKGQERALAACLDWLDEQYPERAWPPAPWAPVVEAIALLRPVRDWLNTGPDVGYGPRAFRDVEQELGQAQALLEASLVGPRAPEELEDTLQVLVDLQLQKRGELGESLLDAVRRMLQAHPDEAIELVGTLKIAGPWESGERHALHHHADIGETELLAHVYEAFGEPGWQAEVEAMPELNGTEALFPSERAAMAAADGRLKREGYGLGGGAALRCGRCNSEGLPQGCEACGERRLPRQDEEIEDEDLCPLCDGDGMVGGCDHCGEEAEDEEDDDGTDEGWEP